MIISISLFESASTRPGWECKHPKFVIAPRSSNRKITDGVLKYLGARRSLFHHLISLSIKFSGTKRLEGDDSAIFAAWQSIHLFSLFLWFSACVTVERCRRSDTTPGS